MSPMFRFSLAFLLFSAAIGAVQALELDTDQKRFSYVLGFQFGQQMKAEGIEVDGSAFAAAIDDVLQGRSLQMSMDEMRTALQAGREKLAKEKQTLADAALKAGKDFLEKNKDQEGVVVLPSGIQYIEQRAGEGTSPGPDSTVTIHYRGTLINGKVFDSSYSRGEPASFKLSGVIPGFRESITLMRPGAKWMVFIPPELGYGEKGTGSSIGPNETLIFDIELISVE